MDKTLFDSPWRNKTRYAAVELLDTLLDVVFPPKCVHCKRPGPILCQRCESSITPAPPLREAVSNVNISDPLEGVIATGLFEGALRDAVHALKYERKLRLSQPLANRLSKSLYQSGWLNMLNLITAVPLHPNRLRDRGYNQAELLARRLASVVDRPCVPRALQRTRDTRSQVGLDYAERQTNLIEAFVATSAVQNQSVLIVDDVYTTGATLRQCATALREAGANHVWALTVAAAPLRDS